MSGKSERNYKTIQRFLTQVDLKSALLRLYLENAEFVIGEPTEMHRHKAPKTEYVGKHKDVEKPGYCLLVLSTPFRGRAQPFSLLVCVVERLTETWCMVSCWLKN
jgi:hypothetical protein